MIACLGIEFLYTLLLMVCIFGKIEAICVIQIAVLANNAKFRVFVIL